MSHVLERPLVTLGFLNGSKETAVVAMTTEAPIPTKELLGWGMGTGDPVWHDAMYYR